MRRIVFQAHLHLRAERRVLQDILDQSERGVVRLLQIRVFSYLGGSPDCILKDTLDNLARLE
jgi:hypothetical protein